MLDLIKKTIKKLRNHPLIEIEVEQINPPIDANLFINLQFAEGVIIPKNIESFYRTANGLTLIWHIKSGLDHETMDKIYSTEEEPGYDYKQPLGTIRILPLEQVLINDWQPPLETDPGGSNSFPFIDKTYTYASFGKMLRPFDIFSNVQCMAFIIFPDETEYKVIMLDNYYADWHHSRITDFETYIKAMCETGFTIPSRQRLFKQFRGDMEPALNFESLSHDTIVPALLKEKF
jgi:hypothetical protein